MQYIHRNIHDNYTSFNNTFTQDKLLEPATIGILTVILTNKPDWVVYPDEIAKRLGVSRPFVTKHFKILENAGYLFVVRKGRGRGKGVEAYRFFSDMPFTETHKEYLSNRLEEELSTGLSTDLSTD